MASSFVNAEAKNNGVLAEALMEARLIQKFGDVEFKDSLIDYYTKSGIPIEIKSCQMFINRADRPDKLRHGEFILDLAQHDYLLQNNGYYVFVVMAGSIVIGAKLLEADDITAHKFHRKLCWKFVFEHGEYLENPALLKEA